MSDADTIDARASDDPMLPARRLLETDHVEWSVDWLRQRIRETERLLERMDGAATDDDSAWMRRALARDLSSKRALLAAMLA